MNRNLKVSKSIEINSNAEEVWDALTNPEKIKIYLFGTETITDWKIGSPIVFQGEYDGHEYKDKGNVLENIGNETLKYDYWSGFSGLEDIPENYSVVTYEFEDLNGATHLMLTQVGFANIESRDHSESAWEMVLDGIKEIVEA